MLNKSMATANKFFPYIVFIFEFAINLIGQHCLAHRILLSRKGQLPGDFKYVTKRMWGDEDID